MPRKEPISPVPKYWRYDLGDGWQAWAGKTDEDNDLLSFTCSRPEDLWFHANAVPGSHVLLKPPADYDEPPSRELIRAAAAVAAYHSKARAAGTVGVCYTHAKFVGKERGAKAGSVVIRQETVIKVRPAIPGAPLAASSPQAN